MWLLLACPAVLMAQSASSSWPVLAAGEKLEYNLRWPSGITLGEATLKATHTGNQMFLEATVDADIPQYHALYTFSSVTDEQFCSQQFRMVLHEGKRIVNDTFEFDQNNHQVHRVRNGRSTTASLSDTDCARDPLALIYYFRQQLALGKLPPGASGVLYLGEAYTVHYDAAAPGPASGSKAPQGELFNIRVDAPNAPNLEVSIRNDPQRVPISLRIAFSLGTLSADLR